MSDDVDREMKDLQDRDQLISSFIDTLTEKGLTFTMCFEEILHYKTRDAEITKDELIQCFHVIGFEYQIYDPNLDVFMRTMSQEDE